MSDLKIPNLNMKSDKYIFKKKLSLRRKSKRRLVIESAFLFVLTSVRPFHGRAHAQRSLSTQAWWRASRPAKTLAATYVTKVVCVRGGQSSSNQNSVNMQNHIIIVTFSFLQFDTMTPKNCSEAFRSLTNYQNIVLEVGRRFNIDFITF